MTADKQQDARATVQAQPTTTDNAAREKNTTVVAGNDSTKAEGSEKLKAEIKRTWSKLSDDEIAFSEKDPSRFNAAVKQKYGLSSEDADKRMKEIKATCGCASKE